MQAVEPAAGLVNGLADVVGGQPAVGLDNAVLEGVMPLGEGHHARVEPAVHHLGDAPENAVAGVRRARPGHIVHVGPMEVEIGQVFAATLGQLRHTADAIHVAASVALPDGYGRAPVAFAGDGPVHIVAQPLSKPSLPDVIGVPVDPGVVAHQTVLDRRGADVPGRLGVIEEGGVAPPAERVGVAIDPLVVQQSSRFQVGEDFGVGVLDELAGERIVAGDDALQIDGLHESQMVLASQAQVLITEGRGDVDDTAAVVHAHKVGGHYPGGIGINVFQRGLAVVVRDELADGSAVFGSIVQWTVG